MLDFNNETRIKPCTLPRIGNSYRGMIQMCVKKAGSKSNSWGFQGRLRPLKNPVF